MRLPVAELARTRFALSFCEFSYRSNLFVRLPWTEALYQVSITQYDMRRLLWPCCESHRRPQISVHHPEKLSRFAHPEGSMTEDISLPRTPELMSRDDTALLVVDVQEKLLPLILDRPQIVWNIRRLIDGARILGVEIGATEQYPQGLGPTTDLLAERLDEIPTKLRFSCGECGGVFRRFVESGRHKVLVVGIEAHVCVGQTVLDLLGNGYQVFVAVDAVGSRREIDYQTALRRMDSAGATLTTTEAALFEWCEVAGTPEFKEISKLVRESPPDED